MQDDFISWLRSQPYDQYILEAVCNAYAICESIYDDNGQPLRVGHTLYDALFYQVSGRLREKDIATFTNECEAISKMSYEQIKASPLFNGHPKSIGIEKRKLTRQDALEWIKYWRDVAERDASLYKKFVITDNTPTTVGWYEVFNKAYGDYYKGEYLFVRPASYSEQTEHTDPEWSLPPSQRTDNRQTRWDNVVADRPYAKLYRDMREDNPETYNSYPRFAVDSMSRDENMGREWVKEGDHFVNRWDRLWRAK